MFFQDIKRRHDIAYELGAAVSGMSADPHLERVNMTIEPGLDDGMGDTLSGE